MPLPPAGSAVPVVTLPSSPASQPSSVAVNVTNELDGTFIRKMSPQEFQEKMNCFQFILNSYPFNFYEKDQLNSLKVRYIYNV